MDDSNSLSYDPFGRIFILNMRHYDMYAIARNLDNPELEEWTICPPYYPLDWRRINKRRIWQTESADMIHWSEPYAVLTPEDGEDGLDETYYGFYPFPVGGVRLGFLNTMSYVSNEIEVRLVYSRNGKTWRHLNKRRPFLAPRGEGHWDSYMATITHDPIRVGDELYIYHGGASNHHDWWISGAREGLDVPEVTEHDGVNYALGLAKLRVDGFVSLDAGPTRRGILVTRPLISEGRRLRANMRCYGGGSIAAEIVDLRDQVIPGFSRQECDIFRGDSVEHTFSLERPDQDAGSALGACPLPGAGIRAVSQDPVLYGEGSVVFVRVCMTDGGERRGGDFQSPAPQGGLTVPPPTI